MKYTIDASTFQGPWRDHKNRKWPCTVILLQTRYRLCLFILCRTKYWSSGVVLNQQQHFRVMVNLSNVIEKDTNWLWAKKILAPSNLQCWEMFNSNNNKQKGISCPTYESSYTGTSGYFPLHCTFPPQGLMLGDCVQWTNEQSCFISTSLLSLWS